MDMQLRGKKILITGGSKGIGLACAQGFAAEGAIVHIASRSEKDLKAAAEGIAKQYKTEVHVHAMDLGKTENAVALISAAGTEAWPRLPKAEVARRLARRIADALPTA